MEEDIEGLRQEFETQNNGLNMHFVPVIWACFGFRHCKKKKFKISQQKKNCFKKVSDPTFFADMGCFGHVAVHVI